MFTDPLERIIHFTILLGPQVIDIHLVLRPLQHHQDRIDAVPDVEIRFPLMSVNEYPQFIRISEELAVKVEDVPMRISFTQDRDESKDKALEAEPFAICLDEPLPGQFGGSVERSLARKGCVFWRGDNPGFTIYRACRSKSDPLYLIGSHRLQHIVCGQCVLFKVPPWVLGSEAYICIGRQVKYKIRGTHRLDQTIQLQPIATAQSKTRSSKPPRKNRFIPTPKMSL